MLCSLEGAAEPGGCTSGWAGRQWGLRGHSPAVPALPAQLRDESRCPPAARGVRARGSCRAQQQKAPGPQRAHPSGEHPPHRSPGGEKTAGGLPRKTPSGAASRGGRRGFLPLLARLSGRMKEFCPVAAQLPDALSGGSSHRSPLGSTEALNKRAGPSVGFYSFLFFSENNCNPLSRDIFFPPPSHRSPFPLCAPPSL